MTGAMTTTIANETGSREAQLAHFRETLEWIGGHDASANGLSGFAAELVEQLTGSAREAIASWNNVALSPSSERRNAFEEAARIAENPPEGDHLNEAERRHSWRLSPRLAEAPWPLRRRVRLPPERRRREPPHDAAAFQPVQRGDRSPPHLQGVDRMIVDEPAFASTLSPSELRRVEIAARAMCRHRDADEEREDERDHCGNCDTPAGGSCVAFGLYGGMALAVIEALDRDRAQRWTGSVSG